MAVLSATTNANLDKSMPLAYEYVAWSSRPVKIVVTTTPGESIVSFVQTAGLPMDFSFSEDIPGSGVWTSFFDTITNGTLFGAGTTVNCFNVDATTGPTFSFCFSVQSAPNPYVELAITKNGTTQTGTLSANTNGFGISSLNGSAILTVNAGDIVRLRNVYPENIRIPGGNSNVSLTIQKID
jgi:hypothetical protein